MCFLPLCLFINYFRAMMRAPVIVGYMFFGVQFWEQHSRFVAPEHLPAAEADTMLLISSTLPPSVLLPHSTTPGFNCASFQELVFSFRLGTRE